jgi:nitrogen-specific signal transduction histidine kinase
MALRILSIGKNTRWGLAIACQILDQRQGKIEVNSSRGKVTQFVITLPIASVSNT